jgi:hypothetical protein
MFADFAFWNLCKSGPRESVDELVCTTKKPCARNAWLKPPSPRSLRRHYPHQVQGVRLPTSQPMAPPLFAERIKEEGGSKSGISEDPSGDISGKQERRKRHKISSFPERFSLAELGSRRRGERNASAACPGSGARVLNAQPSVVERRMATLGERRCSSPLQSLRKVSWIASRVPALTCCAGYGHVAPLPAGSIPGFLIQTNRRGRQVAAI